MADGDALARIGGTALPRAIGETEKNLRIELAAAFRIAHHFGWNRDTLNHITLRLPGTDTFLMNPLGAQTGRRRVRGPALMNPFGAQTRRARSPRRVVAPLCGHM